MTHKDFIENIIKERGQWNIPDGEYWEGHHILPLCMGGQGRTNQKHFNIIRLYPKEHFIAHKLLALENPNNKKLIFAWKSMWFKDKNQKRYEPTAEEYQEVKKLIVIHVSEHFKDLWKTDDFKNKQVWTEERRKIISNSRKGKKLSFETRKKMSISKKGKLSHMKGKNLKKETRDKISLSLSGRKNPMYGKKHSKETKDKLKAINLGKEIYWWNNGTRSTMAKNCPGDGWLRGRLPGFHDKQKRNTKGHKIKRYLWLLPDGTTKSMDILNANKWHKNWVMLKEIKD
jgi:hypothetical protein